MRLLHRVTFSFLLTTFWLGCESSSSYSSGPLVGVKKSTQVAESKPEKKSPANATPTKTQTKPKETTQEQGDPEAKDEDDTPTITIIKPEEVPLAGKTFDAQDSLTTRVTKWQAATGKTKFKKKIVVQKSKRVITIYADEDPIIRYPIELGFAPTGDKAQEGDGKTPEGEFYVCTKNAASKFHRFLGLSYPQPDDAERGIKDGLITTKQKDQILNAHKTKTQPDWNTKLGGAVGIHGSGRFLDLGENLRGYDWTLGCISLTDEASEEIFNFAEMGTPITVYP